MKIAILGIDGYLGWPLALHLIRRGHTVCGIDNSSRRRRVNELGCDSLTPIETLTARKALLRNMQGDIEFADVALGCDSPGYIASFLQNTKPDAIVHLAEQPSAPWSMIGVNYAAATQEENVIGTLHLLWAMYEECPDAHLIKLGTMGEYGTPNCDIPEGEIPEWCMDSDYGNDPAVGHTCPMQGLQFPRQAGSFYHLSKVHDTHNIVFACKNWNLSSTDIMQGPVFGVKTTAMLDEEKLITRFDYDEVFGTVINRFCAQALLGHQLTVYGEGNQTRGYLPIEDSMFCITLAIENPPDKGEYRVFNQFERTYSINELADIVQVAAARNGIVSYVKHYENPRKEAETHYYNPYRQKLVDLGYQPTTDITDDVTRLIADLRPYKDRLDPHRVVPQTRWDIKHRESNIIS